MASHSGGSWLMTKNARPAPRVSSQRHDQINWAGVADLLIELATTPNDSKDTDYDNAPTRRQ